jgi:MarR family transcriptional regulator, transcriptional regulator for hemolysin
MKLAERIGFLCRTMNRQLTRHAAERSDRPIQQLRALWAIDREQIGTQAALAERLCADPPAISRIVDRLEDDGLLKRGEGENRRCVRLELTRAAAKDLSAMNESYAWLDTELRRHLTAKEAKLLDDILSKLIDALASPAGSRDAKSH